MMTKRFAMNRRHTTAYHCDFLVGQVVRPVPSSTMHCLSSEAIHALNYWPFRLTELAYSADKKITRDRVFGTRLGFFAAFGHFDSRLPFLELVIPCRDFSCGAEPDVLVELVILRYAR